MKKLFFSLILLFNFSIVFAQDNVYFLDLDYMLNNSNLGKIVVEKIKKINSQNIEELREKENELKKLESDISTKKNIISDNELNKMVNDLKKKVNLYKSIKNEKVNNINKVRNNELKMFFEKITPYIEEFMQKNSITIILDKKNIFIADSNYDITQKLVDFLNTKKIE